MAKNNESAENESSRQVLLTSPRGFCAGVERAIEIVERALEIFEHPIYVRKEIVHNSHVVSTLEKKGAVFVEELDEVPNGNTVIFSAHGVSPTVREDARSRKLRVIDATCPLVTKVHLEAERYAKQGYTIVLVGHEDHDEVVGTVGEAPENIRVGATTEQAKQLVVPDPSKVAFVTQTTLSVDDTAEIIEALRSKFPAIVGPPKADICYATQNRQTAAKKAAGEAELVLVIGSENSSNANRLAEVARSAGAVAHRINDAKEIDLAWLEGVERVAVTSGASTPEVLVEQVLAFLWSRGLTAVRELLTVEEDVHFPLPRELGAASREDTPKVSG